MGSQIGISVIFIMMLSSLKDIFGKTSVIISRQAFLHIPRVSSGSSKIHKANKGSFEIKSEKEIKKFFSFDE